MTDALAIIQIGDGDKRFSRPAFEAQISEAIGPLELSSITRIVQGGWNSQRFEAVGRWDDTSLTVQYFTGERGHGDDTLQFVGKQKITGSPFTLTASYSPDAFGAGERYRIGAQAYFRSGDVSAFAWVTVRHLPRFNSVDQESWYSLNYHLDENLTLSLRRFDSDFFGDNLTIRLARKF